MDTRFKEIAEAINKSMTKKGYVAFLDEGGNTLYSSLPAGTEGAVKKLSSVFQVWNIGDYQLKKLPKSNMIVYKVSPRIIMALESYDTEGVLIVACKRLEENYRERLNELESQLPAIPAKVTIEAPPEKSNLGVVQEDYFTKETEMFEPISRDITPKGIGGETAKESLKKPSPVGKVEDVITVSFPVLVDKKLLKKVKEPMVAAILELCDGEHTIDDIVEKIGVPKSRVMIVTGDYSAKGGIKYLSGVRRIKR